MASWAQSAEAPSASKDAELQFVVILTRHGVRSPTGKAAKYREFSAAPWPEWDVPPGYLTPHGYDLMKLFGAYDRIKLAGQGLLASSGCGDAVHVTILADSDQRTRETGKALAEGMLPRCAIDVHALPEGSDDPLFHFRGAHTAGPLATAAIAGRIGGDAGHLTEAYRLQLAALDRVLAGCGKSQAAGDKRTSLFDIPASLTPGKGDHSVELRGPLATASTLSENLLLEYTQGMSAENTGWGCLDGAMLRNVLQLHAAESEYAQRTPMLARMTASNLLDNILKALEQSATGKPVAGAPGKPGDRLLILVGHDTNIATVAGALGINWIIDGRSDDTPPGGALVFELWRSQSDGSEFVHVRYTAQTLEQMREAQPLTAQNPPADAPVFLPACSREDQSCTWASFAVAVRADIDPTYVNAQP
jgi:4-phytase/acid phosphatase